MPRMIGALLILIASGAAGFAASRLFYQRVLQLEAFTRLISHIAAEIDSFSSPLDRIFAGYRDETLEKCGFLPALRRSGGAAALDECGGRLYLTAAERAELVKFLGGIGRRGRDETARHCAFYEKRLAALAQSARGELAGQMKVCRTLGLLAGAMLAILLL